MVFSDPLFLFAFLPLLLTVYLASPIALRNSILLGASVGFYTIGERQYTVVMLGAILGNYLVALAIDWNAFNRRTLFLSVGIGANLLALVYFKYVNFLGAELNRVREFLGFAPAEFAPVHLPLGISFFVFQGMSYLIDVYRQEVTAERNLFRFALFKSLFPQLIAGPIVRYQDIARQLKARHAHLDDFGLGLQRFAVGLAKKVLLANPTGLVADQVFGLPAHELSGAVAWLGLFCYAAQIYFDFSGYSDMAIGLGRVFGFPFRENFNYPYTAVTITDFWRRWHLSLSTWFRDYLYIPLGGNRLGPWRTYVNLFIVFALCGLWHGASWNFLLWGAWHGALLCMERGFLAHWLGNRPVVVGHTYTLLAVLVGWVFFRADTLDQAFHYLKALVGLTHATDGQPFWFFVDAELIIALLLAVVGSTPRPRAFFLRTLANMPRTAAVTGSLVGASLMLVLCGAKVAAGAYSPFIYFRF
jgi:alginate O-acetyltransferase complex protein AlgI